VIRWNWQQAFFADTRISGLIEAFDIDSSRLIFLDKLACLFIGIERMHQD